MGFLYEHEVELCKQAKEGGITQSEREVAMNIPREHSNGTGNSVNLNGVPMCMTQTRVPYSYR